MRTRKVIRFRGPCDSRPKHQTTNTARPCHLGIGSGPDVISTPTASVQLAVWVAPGLPFVPRIQSTHEAWPPPLTAKCSINSVHHHRRRPPFFQVCHDQIVQVSFHLGIICKRAIASCLAGLPLAKFGSSLRLPNCPAVKRVSHLFGNIHCHKLRDTSCWQRNLLFHLSSHKLPRTTHDTPQFVDAIGLPSHKPSNSRHAKKGRHANQFNFDGSRINTATNKGR